MLLIIAMLFMRSLGKAQRSNLGFEPSGIINFSMDPMEIGYSEEQGRAFYRNLLTRVRSVPGVKAATTASTVPMGYIGASDTPEIDGYQPPPGEPKPIINYNAVSSDYLPTMKIPLVRGRMINDGDSETAPFVAVVNQAMANRFWPHQDPIGRHFRLGSEPQRVIEVIGIIQDAHFQNIAGNITPLFLVPLAQHYQTNSLATLQIRSSIAPEALVPQVESLIESLAPSMPVFDVQTMTQALDTVNGLLLFQIGAGLAASLGLLGLILAVVGVYGVISYSASQRTHEIGVRMAIGAQPFDILKMVFRQGLLIVCIGLILGMGAAFASARVLESFLTVSATDPLTYLSVAAALTFVALCACYIPARRATKVDPMNALRYE
jgi:predicted permease